MAVLPQIIFKQSSSKNCLIISLSLYFKSGGPTRITTLAISMGYLAFEKFSAFINHCCQIIFFANQHTNPSWVHFPRQNDPFILILSSNFFLQSLSEIACQSFRRLFCGKVPIQIFPSINTSSFPSNSSILFYYSLDLLGFKLFKYYLLNFSAPPSPSRNSILARSNFSKSRLTKLYGCISKKIQALYQ